MKLLLITTSYPDPAADGSEAAGSFVSDFAATLAGKLPVTVLAPGRDEGTEEHGNLTVSRFAGPGFPLSLLKPADPRHWRAIRRVLRRGSRRAEELAGEHGVNHIFALWALPSGYWARQAGRRHGIPYSVWALGSDIWSLGKLPVIGTVLRSVLKGSAHCFADGYRLAEDVERIAGRECGFLPSVRRLPAVAGKSLRDKPPYRFAFLGRWHPNKGIDILLDALALLSDEDWRRIEAFRICGGGPLETLVRERCAALTAAGRPVSLGGYLDRIAAAELLAWTDYLVIPSRIESIPVVFSDAVQAGRPVIATPVGDLPRLMDTYLAGILSREASPAALAAALHTALQSNPLDFVEGLERARTDFDLDHACAQFIRSLSARQG